MNENNEILELMTKLYAEIKEMKSDVGELTDQMVILTNKVVEIDKDLKEVKKTVIKTEDEHGKKLSALFDGYKQNSDILERIEKEVSKHEEIILRRVQ